MRLMSVMSACLQRASCGALHAWAGLCDLLGHVLCTGAEPLLGLSLGLGAYHTTASLPHCGGIHPRLGREQPVLTIVPALQWVAVLGANRS